MYKHGSTLYVSGTKTMSDVARWPQISLRDVEHTPRYAQALQALRQNPDVKQIVGHSYGAAVALRLNETHPGRFQKVRAYGAPRFFASNPANVESYSHIGDPVSIFDVAAHHSGYVGNPHSYAGH